MLVSVLAQGQCMEVIIHAKATITREKPKPVNPRGEVTEFSSQSRMRLMKMTAKISARKIRATGCKPIFLTLTYPSLQENYTEAKRDLKVYIQRLRRLHPDMSGVWKMELQKRGSIHFHLILYGMPFTPVGELQSAWCDVSGQKSNNSLDLEVINSINGVIYYVNKYICKEEDTDFEKALAAKWDGSSVGLSMSHNRPKNTGRWWGVINRKALPFAEVSAFQIDLAWRDYLLWVTQLREKYAKVNRSFTVFSKLVYAYVWRLRQKVKDNLEYYELQARKKRRSRGFRARMWRLDSYTPMFVLRTQRRSLTKKSMEKRKPDHKWIFNTHSVKSDTGKLIPIQKTQRKPPTQLPLL